VLYSSVKKSIFLGGVRVGIEMEYRAQKRNQKDLRAFLRRLRAV